MYCISPDLLQYVMLFYTFGLKTHYYKAAAVSYCSFEFQVGAVFPDDRIPDRLIY